MEERSLDPFVFSMPRFHVLLELYEYVSMTCENKFTRATFQHIESEREGERYLKHETFNLNDAAL